MQIKNISHIIISVAASFLLLSCARTFVPYYDPFYLKEVRRLTRQHNYNNRTQKTYTKLQKNGPFFCISDLDFRYSAFVYYLNNNLVILTDNNGKKHRSVNPVDDNPFQLWDNTSKRILEKELESPFPAYLDGRELFIQIYYGEGVETVWWFEDIGLFLSTGFDSPILSDIQRIVKDYHVLELMYGKNK